MFTRLDRNSLLRRSRLVTATLSLKNAVPRRNVSIAIVGTGPSGFYTAKYLLDARPDTKVDFYERLPYPTGLVRYGVAPDHPEVKSVTSTFADVCNNHSDRVRLFANVAVGDPDLLSSNSAVGGDSSSDPVESIRLEELRQTYDAVVLAYGASSDHRLNLSGSVNPDTGKPLQGILSARSFVNWYNGHPEFTHLHATNDGHQTSKSAPSYAFDLSRTKHVVVVGQGNVALDCARILAHDPHTLESTDIADYALKALHNSRVETITVLGRRGHVQASFTIKELRELTTLAPHATCLIRKDELDLGLTVASQQEVTNNRPKTRIVELMQKIAQQSASYTSTPTATSRTVAVRFLLSPQQVVPSEIDSQRVGRLIVQRTVLTGEAFHQKATIKKDAIEEESLPCDLLLEAVGYRSQPIAHSLPWDHNAHTVQHVNGRVDTSTSANHNSTADANKSNVGGLYAVGWLKRGPSGIIGTNITCAKDTVSSILSDLQAAGQGNSDSKETEDPVHILQQRYPRAYKNSISWLQVQKLDQEEAHRAQVAMLSYANREKVGGENHNKPREKLTSWQDMVRIAHSAN